MPNIRWRIGISVFLLAATLQLVAALYVLERVRRVQASEVEMLLGADLASAEALLGTSQLLDLIRMHESYNSKWNETFVEIDDLRGRPVVASGNVPREGLGASLEVRRVQRRDGSVFSVWERPHPGSRKGHVRMMVAQTRMDEHVVRVGRSLKRYQRSIWRLRAQLAWGLLGVAFLAAGGAWGVTRRALRPLQEITREAQSLGAALDGELPRTGSGDELDTLANVLNGMLGRIRAEMRRVRRITADAAHGLRTPLTALRGQLELHLGSSSEAESARIASLLETLDDMVVLVNRLLLLERLESKVLDRDEPRARVGVDVLVQDVVDAVSIVAEDRRIQLVCESRPVWVLGDAGALRNAVLNLLDNALRHTPAGGGVAVCVRMVGGWVEIEVEDSGPGLRPDQLDRVFERFYSERDGPPGSGLGLAIARAVAESHGGSIVASSPAGARFVARLPPAADGEA